MVRSVFGAKVDPAKVRMKRRRWLPFQPRNTLMAPCGHIHFHPHSDLWRADFSVAPLDLQGLFIHEITHVWQSQTRGRWYLPLHRHPWCRYDYELIPGRTFDLYGIEQQAEIVRHAFLLERGCAIAGAAPCEAYRGVLPFAPGV